MNLLIQLIKNQKKEIYDCLFEISSNKTIIIIDHNLDGDAPKGNIINLSVM